MFYLQPRRFSTTVPPPKPGPGTPPSEGSRNTTLYVGAAAVGLGGLYYYYFMSDPRARSDAERMKQKSRELGDTVKDSAHNKLQQGQDKADEYRVRAVTFRVILRRVTYGLIFLQASGKEKLERTRQEAERSKDDARAGIKETQKDVQSTLSGYGHDAQRKLDEYKTSASSALVDARDDTEKKLEEAKAAGSSWFSWGSGKAEDAKKDAAKNIKQEADKRL